MRRPLLWWDSRWVKVAVARRATEIARKRMLLVNECVTTTEILAGRKSKLIMKQSGAEFHVGRRVQRRGAGLLYLAWAGGRLDWMARGRLTTDDGRIHSFEDETSIPFACTFIHHFACEDPHG